MPQLGDFLKSINQSKVNLMDQDHLAERDYLPFVVNRTLSYFVDTVLYANEMNRRHTTDFKMQYDYLVGAVRANHRFSRWIKPEKIVDLELVKEYYGYGNAKAHQALAILTDVQLDIIRLHLDKGGRA